MARRLGVVAHLAVVGARGWRAMSGSLAFASERGWGMTGDGRWATGDRQQVNQKKKVRKFEK